MRIVHIIDYFQPSLGYQETFLARAHLRQGHEVHVVTADRYSNRPDYETRWRPLLGQRILEPGVSEWDGIQVHRIGSYFEIGPRPWIKGLPGYVASLKPDFLIVHGMVTMTPIRMAKALLRSRANTPVVFDSHASAVNSLHPLRSIYYLILKKLYTNTFLRAASAIVAIDEDSKRFLITQLAVPSDRITVIPLGVDTNRFYRDMAQRVAIREQLQISPEAIVAIYAGKVEERKGVHLLIDAATKLMASGVALHVILVGNGPSEYVNELNQRMGPYRSSFSLVKMVANIDLPNYYSAADISVWPKQVSIGTFEAQACELPLIVGDAPILRDRVTEQDGLLCEVDSVDSLANQLSKLIVDSELRSYLGKNAREKVVSKYDWNMLAQQFLDAPSLHNASQCAR